MKGAYENHLHSLTHTHTHTHTHTQTERSSSIKKKKTFADNLLTPMSSKMSISFFPQSKRN